MKERLLYLDAIKGIAILLVVMGHINTFADIDTLPLPSYVTWFIGSVHMALFVMISGYFSQKPLTSFSEWGGVLKR